MQLKIIPTAIETIVKRSDSAVYHRSAKLIAAVKPANYGRLRIKFRQPSDPDNAKYYWFCDIHLETGLPPDRYFDAPEVKEFAERYVAPFVYS